MQQVELSNRLDILSKRGVRLVDPRQVYIDQNVRLDRIFPGSTLFPGTRLIGDAVLIGPGALIGTEGPATIIDSAIGENAEIASGYLHRAVVLPRARAGSNAHFRAGTLLEEEASTAHAVGLKETILTCFVTLGSLINCCDCLVSGGRARNSHTEIGSGFIHFNFTPWGGTGDKATPSLIGGVPRGVFLREEKTFIGGLSGLVGPRKVGFGTFTVAGQVVRSDVGDNNLYSEVPRSAKATWDFEKVSPVEPRLTKNLEYIGHLYALRAWYVHVRIGRLPRQAVSSHLRLTLDAAVTLIDNSIQERKKRLDEFLRARGAVLPSIVEPLAPCPLKIVESPISHIDWISKLETEEIRTGTAWLQSIIDQVVLLSGQKIEVGPGSLGQN